VASAGLFSDIANVAKPMGHLNFVVARDKNVNYFTWQSVVALERVQMTLIKQLSQLVGVVLRCPFLAFQGGR